MNAVAPHSGVILKAWIVPSQSARESFLPVASNETTRIAQENAPLVISAMGPALHTMPVNTFATPGHAKCEPLSCAAGYHCHPDNPTVEIACGSIDKYCPANTFAESGFDATPGLYTVGGGNNTRSSQTKCEPGYYCSGGIRYACGAAHKWCPGGHCTSLTSICWFLHHSVNIDPTLRTGQSPVNPPNSATAAVTCWIRVQLDLS